MSGRLSPGAECLLVSDLVVNDVELEGFNCGQHSMRVHSKFAEGANILIARTCVLILGLIASTTFAQSEVVEDRPVDFSTKGAQLEFSPPRLRYCGLPVQRTRITVSWDATAAGVNRTQVYLHEVGDRLFSSGGAVGESETGEWVTNGTRFILYSPELDEVLAEKSFRLIPCNTREYPDELPSES